MHLWGVSMRIFNVPQLSQCDSETVSLTLPNFSNAEEYSQAWIGPKSQVTASFDFASWA